MDNFRNYCFNIVHSIIVTLAMKVHIMNLGRAKSLQTLEFYAYSFKVYVAE